MKSLKQVLLVAVAITMIAWGMGALRPMLATGAVGQGVNPQPITDTGTWTPTLRGTATAGSCTYTTRVGRWEKTGNRVKATGNILVSSCGTPPVGDLLIAGLPFTSNATADGSGCYWTRAEDYVLTNASDTIVLEIQAATTSVRLQAYAPGAATAASAPIDSAFTLRFVCDYKTAK